MRPKLGEYIRENELFAKKSLGQHFLLDINLTSKIAGLLQIDEDTVIFEIGPGPGGLTQALLNTKAKKIIAIEKDERFVEHLKTYFHDDLGRLEIISGDALKISPATYLREHNIECKSAKIIANLPYNVGTQLFLNWVTGEEKDWEMALMFQMEVAKRICAQTGDNHYGRLAILTNAVCYANIGMHVPRLAFSPPPKVESAVAVITPKKKNRYDDLETLGKVTQAAFSQRRKMLRSSLASLGNAEALCEAAGVKPTLRPEQLSPEGFYALCEAVKNTSN